jgi:hypothetical protein
MSDAISRFPPIQPTLNRGRTFTLVPHHFCEHFRFSLNNRPRQRSPIFPLLRESQITGLVRFFILGSFHRFPIRHFRRMFFQFRFDFTQFETVDMPTPKSAATFRKISPFLIRLTASNFCSIVITTRFRLADTVCNHRQTKC